MELNKDQLFEIAKHKIKEFEIDRITNLFGHLPIDIRSFFYCFPVGSKEYNELIELTKQNERLDIEN